MITLFFPSYNLKFNFVHCFFFVAIPLVSSDASAEFFWLVFLKRFLPVKRLIFPHNRIVHRLQLSANMRLKSFQIQTPLPFLVSRLLLLWISIVFHLYIQMRTITKKEFSYSCLCRLMLNLHLYVHALYTHPFYFLLQICYPNMLLNIYQKYSFHERKIFVDCFAIAVES